MEVSENKGFVYEFGDFVIDPNERTLSVNGQPIHLPAKEFETLLLLVRFNGHALTKEEMISAIWRDSFVEEGNLAKQISSLRRIFNTDGKSLIETIPKHGYRFKVADLRYREPEPLEPVVVEKRTVKRVTVNLQGSESEPSSPAARLSGPQYGTRSHALWMGAGLLMIAVVGAGIYLWLSSVRSSATPVVKSVAVLPFKPVASDDSDEYLRLGLTDALITKLSSLKQVVVRPTNAVRNFGDRDPMAAGRELKVDAVLDGNVQRVGQQIRVTVQLVNVRDGSLLWGGKFDEKFTDIFSVQDAISEQVALELEPGLTGEERTSLAKRHTTSADAHHAYVLGRIFWNKRTATDFEQAIVHFNEAVRKDPNYALAYAGLADSYCLLADYQGAPAPQSYEKARTAALKALELDDSLAEAQTSLAYISMYRDWDWEGAERRYRLAIARNPNYATAHQWYAEFLTAMGRFDDALAEIRRAKEIDPLSAVINAGEVWTLYFARRYDEAIEQGRNLYQLRPDFAEVQEYLKRCYDQKGMYREAIAARQMRRKLAGRDPSETPLIRRAASAESHETYWSSRLEQELIESETEGTEAFNLAEIYAQLGDKDKAFGWLEKAFEERTYTMMYLKVAPNLDPLRSDQRFAAMLSRVGLNS